MVESKFVELGANDKKAKDFILESLGICAHDHILSRKLIDRYSMATGPMVAIAPNWIDLSQLATYGESYDAPPGSPPYADGDRPRQHLVAFVLDYLRAATDGIVVCENWGWERKHIAMQPCPPPVVACYGDNEVYHIVLPGMSDPEMIDSAICQRHHWQTNVCSSSAHLPEGDIRDEAFLDEIVRNTKHIFIPAFDGSGSLIWSPTA